MLYDVLVIEAVSPYLARKTVVETFEAAYIECQTGMVTFFNEKDDPIRVIPVPPFYISEHTEA